MRMRHCGVNMEKKEGQNFARIVYEFAKPLPAARAFIFSVKKCWPESELRWVKVVYAMSQGTTNPWGQKPWQADPFLESAQVPSFPAKFLVLFPFWNGWIFKASTALGCSAIWVGIFTFPLVHRRDQLKHNQLQHPPSTTTKTSPIAVNFIHLFPPFFPPTCRDPVHSSEKR